MEIEGAAAISQGTMGMIPEQAGKDILKAATSERSRRHGSRVGGCKRHDTAALVEALS